MSKISFAVCLAIAATCVSAQTTKYGAPRDGLDNAGMSYQLGIWTMILLLAIGIYGFYSLGSLDYSGDTALFVDTTSAGGGEQH